MNDQDVTKVLDCLQGIHHQLMKLYDCLSELVEKSGKGDDMQPKHKSTPAGMSMNGNG